MRDKDKPKVIIGQEDETNEDDDELKNQRLNLLESNLEKEDLASKTTKLESIIIYDENRNLNLGKTREKFDKNKQQDFTSRQRSETSPVLSLATSDGIQDSTGAQSSGVSRRIMYDYLSGGNSSNNLVRQLGRRVSELPQYFSRKLSISRLNDDNIKRASITTHHHHQQQQQQLEKDTRRYSMQNTFECSNDNHDEHVVEEELNHQPVISGHSYLASSSQSSSPQLLVSSSTMDASLSATNELDASNCHQVSLPISPSSNHQVAGVAGGTITTVTKKSRKTAPLPRLVAKNGTVNLFLDNIDRRQYVRDLFTTMIDIKWRYNLMAAAFGFVFSWLFFACIWYLVLLIHDDLSHENDSNWSPCIVNVNSFSAALLFSIETQSTLGFGSRIISVECPGAIIIFCIQLIFGVVVECLIVGMVFAKLSRPAKRSQTIMYSKYATICLRQGKMCLMFRVGDVRSKSHVIGATIRASLVSQKITDEGEIIPFYHHQLKVKIDDSRDNLLLIWPVTIVHFIEDESSPFYNLNSEQLSNFKFEIITVLEGTVESTGQSIQVRSSYLPSEVKWGCRFEPVVSTHGFGRYAQTIIDYNKFNRVVEVETPKCSPMEYYTMKLKQSEQTTNSSQSSSSSRSTASSRMGEEQLMLDITSQ